MHRSLLLLLLIPLAAPAAGAQSRQPGSIPFGTIALSLAAAGVAERSGNLDGWEPSPGFEVRALFPFHAGSVEFGAAQTSFDSHIDGVPGFRARYVFIGWGAAARPIARVAWRTGVRLGVYDLQFDDETIPDYARSENEIATELVSDLAFDLGRRWSLLGGAGGRVVFTRPRMRQLTVTVGVRRTFDSPEWLRDFLD